VAIDSGCEGNRRVGVDAATGPAPSPARNVVIAPPAGKQLWESGVPREARSAALTWPERLWVYNVFMLLPVYAAAALSAADLVGPGGWKDATPSPWATVTVVVIVAAMLHLWNWVMETVLMGRRSKAVLSRPLRHGRHSWATADGDRVRVYRIEPERTLVPHLWPLALGVRGRVDGGREFSAEDEAEAAFEYVAELERARRPDPAATALVRVLNEHVWPPT
jgi:hypothetical protein